MIRTILLAMLLAISPHLHAADRPTVAILPFGIAKDRNTLQWLSFATASTLTETLRRNPSVRTVPFANIVQELRSAGITPMQAAWTPAVTTEPLGQWLNADRVLLGAIGKISDQKAANIILQAQEPPAPQKGSQIWLAARVANIANGQTLASAYVEGRTEDMLQLQNKLLMQLGNALNIDPLFNAQSPMQASDFSTYENTAEIEQYIFDLPTLTSDKQRERTLKRASKQLERILQRNPELAVAHTYQGIIFGLQNKPQAAMRAFETAIKKDPAYTAPYYGLIDMALQEENLPQAVTWLTTITQVTPWDDDAFHLQGTIYRLLNQPEQALLAYEQALEAYDKRPETHYEVGKLYLSKDQSRKAILHLQQAVEQMPGELTYQILLADAHLSAQETARARVVLDRIATVSETDPEYQFVRGKFDHQIEQYENALTHFNRAIESLPDRADIHAAMGQTYMAQKRYTDAINAFITAQSHGMALPQIALPFGKALEAENQVTEAEDLYRQTLQQDPSRADLRLRFVKHLLNRKAVKEAIETLLVGIKLHPNRGDFHLLLGDLYASQNENVLAIRHYEKALSLGVSPTDVAAQLAHLYLVQNQPEQAKTYFEKAHHAGTMNANIYAGLGMAEEQLGNSKAALNAFRQALKANPQHTQAQEAITRLSKALRPKPQPPTAQNYANRAERAYQSGDWTAAQSAYEKALGMSPKRSDWWSSLGTLYVQQGQPKRAETAFQNAIQNAPQMPEYHYNLGKLYTDMGWLLDAESVCREALKVDPNYTPAQQQLGAIYLAQGEYHRAKSTFTSLVNKDANNAVAQLGLGNALSALGEWETAETAYKAAKKVGVAATIGVGNLLLAQQDTARAITYYEQAQKQNPNNPTSYVNLGLIYANRGQFELALSTYQKALNLAPNDPDVLTNLIALYTQAAQYNDALDFCRTLQEKLPDAAQPQKLTGAVAYAAGRFELALIAYQNALDISPKDPDTLQGIASTYEALDNPEAAQEHWQMWLNSVGDDPQFSQEATRVIEHLQTLATLSVTSQGLFP
jgi:tetratricopeptide (TPR) repeat protein